MAGFSLFLLGLIFTVFQLAPMFLDTALSSVFTWGDLFDFLTPPALLSSLYLVYSRIKNLHFPDPPHRLQRAAARALMALGGVVFVEGHGMHLATNALGRLTGGGSDQGLSAAVYFFDERLSHILTDGGVILFSLGLLLWSRRIPVSSWPRREIGWLLAGGLLFGFTFFGNGVEGQTVPFTLPAAVLLALLSLRTWLGDRRLSQNNPVAVFFMVAYGTALALFVTWGILYPGFPEFSALGWF